MGHKTLIGGTAYEISGGKTLVGGTGYEIAKGKTLVGGTAYEVGFAPSVCTVTITVDGDGSYAWLEIDGSEYYENQTLELAAGTVIKCCIYKSGNVYINGEIYAGGNGEWEYTVTKNCTINLYDHTDGGDIYITEIPEGYALVNIAASGMGIGSGNTGVTIEGTTYKDTNTLVVPVGTVITCSADNDDNKSMNFGIITVNGENVAVAGYDFTTVTYNYTVTGNVTILLNYNKGDGKVTITEQ